MPGFRLTVSALTLIFLSVLLLGLNQSRQLLCFRSEAIRQSRASNSKGFTIRSNTLWPRHDIRSASIVVRPILTLYIARQIPRRASMLYSHPIGASIRPRQSADQTSQTARWQMALSLTGYGYKNDFVAFASPALEATDNRIDLRHKP